MTKQKPIEDRLVECFAEAKNYQSRTDFFKGSHAEYCYLQSKGKLKEACLHMPLSEKYSYVRWDQKSVIAEAAKYGSRAEFKRNCSGAYEHALSNGYLNQVCAHMRDGTKFWHVFELMAAALKYDNWSEFIKAEPQAYNFANKNKLAGIASAHMRKARRAWSKESVLAEAAKHQSRSMFISMASGAYKHALANGYVDEVFSHMDNLRGQDWDKGKVLNEAGKYKTRTDFQAGAGGAHAHALRNGYLDEACAHMEIRKRDLDREFVLSEAKKYKSRSHFKTMEPSCYLHAKRNGFLDEACAHMGKPLPSGFKDAGKANLYHLRVTCPDGLILFKIGITNRTPKDRIQSLYLNEGITAEVLDVIEFETGRDARIAEKRLHRKMSSFRYSGPPLMRNGNTELFTENILDFEGESNAPRNL